MIELYVTLTGFFFIDSNSNDYTCTTEQTIYTSWSYTIINRRFIEVFKDSDVTENIGWTSKMMITFQMDDNCIRHLTQMFRKQTYWHIAYQKISAKDNSSDAINKTLTIHKTSKFNIGFKTFKKLLTDFKSALSSEA